MSRRTSIVKALVEKLKLINGEAPYTVNLYENAYARLEFWDSCSNFPSIYSSPGTEVREYLPSNFTWGYLNVSLKVYCKGEGSTDQLESLLTDIETVVNNNRQVVYDSVNNYETTEILITSITTDEGLLYPYAVGEVNLQVRYEIPVTV